MRYPKRPGLSIGDEVVENGAIQRISSNRLCGLHPASRGDLSYAPFCTALVHFITPRRSWDLYLIKFFAIPSQLIGFTVRGRGCNLPISQVSSRSEIPSSSLVEISGDYNLDP